MGISKAYLKILYLLSTALIDTFVLMMKKVSILILTLVYAVTASGFALNLHYCGNTVADVKINAPAKSCIKPSAKQKMKCCKDSQLTVKVKDDHQKRSSSLLQKLFAVSLPRLSFTDFLTPVQQQLLERVLRRGPPEAPPDSLAVYLKNRTLRI